MTLSTPGADQRRQQVLDRLDRGAVLAEHGRVVDGRRRGRRVAGISTPEIGPAEDRMPVSAGAGLSVRVTFEPGVKADAGAGDLTSEGPL